MAPYQLWQVFLFSFSMSCTIVAATMHIESYIGQEYPTADVQVERRSGPSTCWGIDSLATQTLKRLVWRACVCVIPSIKANAA